MSANIISTRPTKFIEENAEAILKRWEKIVLSDKSTITFTREHLFEIESNVREIISELGKWIGHEATAEEIGNIYAVEGIKFFKMEIPMCEVVRALTLLRTTVIKFVTEQLLFETSFEMQLLYDLVSRMILFFDRAQYYITRGYTEEMNKKMKELWNLTEEETEKIFFERSFYKKS